MKIKKGVYILAQVSPPLTNYFEEVSHTKANHPPT